MLTGETIVCISSIDWDFNWQVHQEVMSALAARGNRVLFVENTGVRAPTLRDLPRLRRRVRNWRRGVRGFRQEGEQLFVYSPLVLPLPYSRLARWLNRTILARALRRWMRAIGCARPIVFTFLPTPLVRDLVRELDPELTVYYCIDDLPTSSHAARRVSASEVEMFRRADLVLVTAEKLRARAAEYRAQVHLVPSGVSYPKFERARLGSAPAPADVAQLPRPVLGYVGGVNRLIDTELLAGVAALLPRASFVLVGPVQDNVPGLTGRPNVRLLGPRPHDEVPGYIKAFDVGLIPYRLTEYTSHIYPTKLNEYLAMGIPVVATDLAEVRRFNAEHGEVVAIAADATGFAKAVARAVESTEAGLAERRVEIARRNSWDMRIAAIAGLMEEGLGRGRGSGGWQDALQRLYRTARRRVARVVAGIVAAYLLAFHTPLLWVLAAPLRVADPPRPADAIVVFAGGVGESGKAGGGYQERVKQAVDLYQAGLAPVLVFSSGFVFAFREAAVMRDLAVSQGVPPAAIVLESRAMNTYQNVAFVGAILREHGWRTVLLVTSPYHTRRAVWTWRRALPDIQVAATPVPESQFYRHEWGASLEQVRGIAQEYVAIAAYWWRGWL